MREYFLKLDEKIKSKEDLIFFLEEIDLASDLILREPKKELSQKLRGRIVSDLVEILEELKKKEKQYQDPQEQIFFLQLLKKYLTSLPKIKIEIAFEPERKTLKKISQWFKENLKKKVILDLKINPKIIGGVKIEYRGKWRDFSLAKKIKEMKFDI